MCATVDIQEKMAIRVRFVPRISTKTPQVTCVFHVVQTVYHRLPVIRTKIASVTRDIIIFLDHLRPAQIFQMTEIPLQHGLIVMEEEMIATVMEQTTGVRDMEK